MSFPNLSALAVREGQLTLFFLIISLCAGASAFLSLGRAEDPAIRMQMLVVSAVWPGASNDDMENIVVRKLEKKLQELENLYRIQTSIRDGRADIMVAFQDYTSNEKLTELLYQVRKRMQDITPELPAGVMGPWVNDDFSDVYFSLIAVSAPGLPLRDITREAERLRDELRQIPGVLKVNLLGEHPERIWVDIDNAKLLNLGISPLQVFDTIDAFNAVHSGGFVETQGPKLWLRPSSGLADPDRLRGLPFHIDGRIVTLSQFARVHAGHEEPPSFQIRANGEDALLLGAIMAPGENGLQLGRRIQGFIDTQRTLLPAGIHLVEIADQSEAIDAAVSLFEIKFLVAVAVVMGVGFLALGWRAGMIVGIVVPATLGLTFVLMKLMGVNLDRITLGALIIALGLLVDDAIISIEMILVKLEQGWDKMRAAAHAWNVTAAPMLWGTLITMFGFVPIGFANSGVREYAGNIFWVLAFSLLLSWLVAVTFAPWLGVNLLSPKRREGHQDEASVYDTPFYRRFRSLVTLSLRRSGMTVSITAALLVAAFVTMATLIEKQFFPGSDRPEVVIGIQLPAGTSVHRTEEVVKRLESMLVGREDVRHFTSYIGAGAPRFFISINPEYPDSAFAKIIVVTTGPRARDALIRELEAHAREGEFPEARLRVNALLFGPPVQWPLSFRIIGPDFATLQQLGGQVRDVMAAHPHVTPPITDWGERVPRLHVDMDNDRLAHLGLTPRDVARQMQFRNQGIPVTAVRQDMRNVEVWVRADKSAGQPPIYELFNDAGRKIPLTQVAMPSIRYEQALVRRHDGQRFIEVMADVVDAQPQDTSLALWKTLAPLRQSLPPGYRMEIGGSFEQSAKSEKSINDVFPLMVGLMLVCIMMQMRSFQGALVVLATAPLGVVGAAIVLLVCGQPFGFVAMLGLIGLGGILMRNTLILTQQVSDNLNAGMPPAIAIVEATVMRARPVALTGLAAALAFVPLASDSFWGPLAYTLIGGVLVGTLMTLFVVPALYSLIMLRKAPAEAP